MIRVRPCGPAGLVVALLLVVIAPSVVVSADAGWAEVDYGSLVDRRVLSHSGEPVGVLLERLGGRPLPPPGERPEDRLAHALLDPLLEPYAFVLPDVLDSLEPMGEAPLVEVGSLWLPGQRQPAWAELLRARRFVVESDGRGHLRLILPAPARATQAGSSSGEAARAAYESAWPVLRHVLAAELARLAAKASEPPVLTVRVYAYEHQPERTRFRLGRSAYETLVSDAGPDGNRPPFDFAALESFLASGMQLEGGRLGPRGSLHLLGSAAPHPSTLVGRRIEPADFAVAYRAVVHGGLSEPYMSLDRGFSPHESMVSYGGRLRDTAVGLVSLLCDIRFKTFSLGIDIATGRDVREEVRARIPGFRTHLERFAADPASAGIQAQQTRLWFYPDSVDLTLSVQGDVLAMRRVRMSAASERVATSTMTATSGEDPSWTRATVTGINAEYDELADFFPELADLDQVVRLLSLFTWLQRADQAGLLVPDLDALLAVELPETYTPRRFPQLLTFNALPEAGSETPVVAYDRVPVGRALDGLEARGLQPLPARSRLERALAALDPSDPQSAALLEEVAGYDLDQTEDTTLDLLTYRAERLRMHRLVLSTLDRARAEPLAKRQQGGEDLRIFSVGIGGLDLGMGQVLARAQGSSMQLALAGGAASRSTPVASPGSTTANTTSRDEWREERAETPRSVMPDHGIDARRSGPGDPIVEETAFQQDGGSKGIRLRVVLGPSDQQARARTVFLDERRRPVSFERLENGRLLGYRVEEHSGVFSARPVAPRAPAIDESAATPLSEGLVRLRIGESAGPTVRLRLEFVREGSQRQIEADVPDAVLQRLVMGRDVDTAPLQPLPLAPLPPVLGPVTAVMFQVEPRTVLPPWESAWVPTPGEQDSARIARALNRWSADGPPAQASVPAVVGTDAARSPGRWAEAPIPGGRGTLILPSGAFSPGEQGLRDRLADGWTAGPVVDGLPQTLETDLVVVVSPEPPGACAARLEGLLEDPRLSGKLLAGWCLAAPIRPDLPGAMAASGGIAGLGMASSDFVDVRRAPRLLADYAESLRSPLASSSRIEGIDGPFLWYF